MSVIVQLAKPHVTEYPNVLDGFSTDKIPAANSAIDTDWEGEDFIEYGHCRYSTVGSLKNSI